MSDRESPSAAAAHREDDDGQSGADGRDGGGGGTAATSSVAAAAAEEEEGAVENPLLLFLGLHPTHQGPPPMIAWQYLSLQDMLNVRCLSRSIYDGLRMTPYTQCRDGADYQVPFPGFPGLFSTERDRELGHGLFAHQLASLASMHQMETSTTEFGALRGGILGDAPGLGKTITMLALISSTAGQRPTNPPEFWDASNLEESWQAVRSNVARRVDIWQTIRPIETWMHNNIGQYKTIDLEHHANFQHLRSELGQLPYKTNQFPTIASFEDHVKSSLLYKCGLHRAQLEMFRVQMAQFKSRLDKRCRGLLCSPQGRRLEQERKLLPSCATLIVVPDALLEHWYQQITQHLDLVRFSERASNGIRGVVYLDGIGDIDDATMPLPGVRFDRQMPTEWELNQYHIVVTSFSRCEGEYNRLVDAGHLVGDDNITTSGGTSRKRRGRGAPVAVQGSDSSSSSLLRMRWLRLVVDEGHELGEHEALSSVTRFIHEIASERRWIMSGTPTTGDEDSKQFAAKALDQLQRLLVFLRHPAYGGIPAKTTSTSKGNDGHEERKRRAKLEWELVVKDPFLNKNPAGRKELLNALKKIMVRHGKQDIHLPKPIFGQCNVDVPITDSILVQLRGCGEPAAAEAFLSEYLHSDEYQSAVDSSQASYIVTEIRKARDSLRDQGGPVMDSAEVICNYRQMGQINDRRPIKAVVYSSNSNVLLSVTEHLYRNLSEENIAEVYHGHHAVHAGDLNRELSRFRNGIKEIRTCPVCNRENDLEYHGSRIDHCQQTLLEVEVDPSVVPPGEPTRFLIEPERIVSALHIPVERMQGEPLTSYGKHQKFWTVGDTLEVDFRDPHPVLPRRETEDTWEGYGSKKCMERAALHNYVGVDWYMGPLPEVGRRLASLRKWQKCCQFHNGWWYKGAKLVDMPIEKVAQDVYLLALDAKNSTGLDLSFVTHIFLLEAIEDAALLEQVTSRAHRLGATAPVIINTVNTFWALPDDIERASQESWSTHEADNKSSPTKQLRQDKERTLTKVVCTYCYRQFNSITKAEEHERTTCQHNPTSVGVADPFHLSSIYQSIKPPSPLLRNNRELQATTVNR